MGQGQHQGETSSAAVAGEAVRPLFDLFGWRQLRAAFELHVPQRTAQVQRAVDSPVVHEAARLQRADPCRV